MKTLFLCPVEASPGFSIEKTQRRNTNAITLTEGPVLGMPQEVDSFDDASFGVVEGGLSRFASFCSS
jgi:hypothetical protein